MKKGRKYRKFEIERIMGRLAWSANELTSQLGISSLNTRRYLRRYFYAKRLTRKKFGTIWYYAVTRFLSPPNFTYKCPRCSGRMDVYKNRCGCEFQLCSASAEHSVFKYCERHAGTHPRFIKVLAHCAVCGAEEVVKIDRKEGNKILADWQYFGRLLIPPNTEKIEYWECPRCIKSEQEIKTSQL